MTWYLRSMHDHDTHRADQLGADGVVLARCGVEFVPKMLALGRVALPGNPLDPDQICPECAQQNR